MSSCPQFDTAPPDQTVIGGALVAVQQAVMNGGPDWPEAAACEGTATLALDEADEAAHPVIDCQGQVTRNGAPQPTPAGTAEVAPEVPATGTASSPAAQAAAAGTGPSSLPATSQPGAFTPLQRKEGLLRGSARPPAPPVDPEGIPVVLRECGRWICWRWEFRDQWTKPPVNPRNGQRCNAQEPTNWTDFATAWQVCATDPDLFHGVGVVLGDGLAGVDIDGCRDPQTGAILPWAHEIIGRLNSYTDVSPTGTGIKILLDVAGAVVPGGKTKTAYQGGEIEVYTAGRYFTITGSTVPGTPFAVPIRPDELCQLYGEIFGAPTRPSDLAAKVADPEANTWTGLSDDEVLEVASRAKNGKNFVDLWNGDTTAYDADDSRADLALCNYLAFYSGDPEQVDRLFRRSSLYRPKWDEGRGDSTYGRWTTSMAFLDRSDCYRPRKTAEPSSRGPDDRIAAAAAKRRLGVRNELVCPWPAPPDAAAFHGLAGDFVQLVEPHSEADPVALLAQFLVAFGAAVGRKAYFAVEGVKHYLNEFLVLVGESAKGRKGSSWGHVENVIKQMLPAWSTEGIVHGLSTGEGLVWRVRDAVMTHHERKDKGNVIGYEAVESDPGVPDKRLLVCESEYARVLKQLERQGNTLSSVLRQAWETGNLQSLTKNSPVKATGAHVSLIGHITAEELRRYLTATESANGFANRFLWLCARRSKMLPFGGEVPDAESLALGDRCCKAFDYAGTVNWMGLTASAREAWEAVYPSLSRGRGGLAGSMLSRAEAHVRRLACLYALLDKKSDVDLVHLEAALALWEYVEGSVGHVFGVAIGNKLADEILVHLLQHPDGMTREDIRQLYNRHRSSEDIGAALAVLEDHGLAWSRSQTTGGRPAERWLAGDAGEGGE